MSLSLCLCVFDTDGELGEWSYLDTFSSVSSFWLASTLPDNTICICICITICIPSCWAGSRWWVRWLVVFRHCLTRVFFLTLLDNTVRSSRSYVCLSDWHGPVRYVSQSLNEERLETAGAGDQRALQYRPVAFFHVGLPCIGLTISKKDFCLYMGWVGKGKGSPSRGGSATSEL